MMFTEMKEAVVNKLATIRVQDVTLIILCALSIYLFRVQQHHTLLPQWRHDFNMSYYDNGVSISDGLPCSTLSPHQPPTDTCIAKLCKNIPNLLRCALLCNYDTQARKQSCDGLLQYFLMWKWRGDFTQPLALQNYLRQSKFMNYCSYPLES